MTLYDIDERIEALLSEDGEIADFEEFDKLQMEREQKIENAALAYKNYMAEARAIKVEEDALKRRRTACENRAEGLKCYLDYALSGAKFKSAKVSISYRTSKRCTLDDDFIEWAQEHAEELLRYKAPEPNKTIIADKLKAGEDIPHAHIEVINNISIR
jgi:hypothetical protein